MEESLPPDELQDLIKEFILETEENLEGLDKYFIALESAPTDMVLINEIFRAVHSVKGSAGFLGLNRLVEVAHHSENILNKLRKNSMQANAEIIDVILESVDVLRNLIKEVKENRRELIDISPIKKKLALLQEDNCYVNETIHSTKSETGEKVAESNEDEESVNQVIAEDKSAVSSDQDKDATIRVNTKKLDHVMDLVGELVLGRNRLNKITAEIEEHCNGDERLKSMLETVSNLNLITSDLQLSVMKMRMIPLKKVFNKIPRMIRDIARKSDKKISLEMYGETTEVDKSVIDIIGDPLIHIIRNSIDHGIETPEERLRMQKPECGTIEIGAFQEGNLIVIQIEDDGRGIDPAVIERKARENGFIKPQDASLSSREIINLIFEPGFSTAEKVTDISGRGVGMDIVKTKIGRINGIIDIHSEVGKGTRVTLKIPLTLAIIQVLMVRVEDCIYALPLSSILETVRIPLASIRSIDDREVMSVRERLIPLMRLGDILGIKKVRTASDYSYVVIVAVAEKRIGIIVDDLCHQEEVVIKSVGNYFSEVSEISGATITGDGQIGLILDPAALLTGHRNLTAKV